MDFATLHHGMSQFLLDERLHEEELSSEKLSNEGYAHVILAELQKLYGAETMGALCDIRRHPTDREFIASSLIRIYRLSEETLKGNLHHVSRLCENAYDPQSREMRNASSAGKQSFEKISAYTKILERTTRKAAELESHFGALNQFDGARREFLKNLVLAESRAFILPFVTPEFRVPSAFTYLFQCVQDYIRSEGPEKFASFNRVDEAFGVITAKPQSATWRVTYGKALGRLRGAVANDYWSSEILKPAKLTLSPASRKYPLHIGGREFVISFVIENKGPGIAFGVELAVTSTLEKPHAIVHLARVDPGVMTVAVPAVVDDAGVSRVLCEAALRWTTVAAPAGSEDDSSDLIPGEATSRWPNLGSQSITTSVDFELEGQTSKVDWSMVFEDAIYSIDPVTNEDKLLGRHDLLRALTTRFSHGAMPSYLIYGQRRVGKTSVVRSLEDALRKRDPNYHIVYAEAGEFATDQTESSLSSLGSTLARRLMVTLPDLTASRSVSFEHSIAPLGDILDDYSRAHPKAKFLFIVDEFDALPIELYRRGPIGDTLFLNLRSLSAKTNVGFILVGSENMSQILNQQGEQINKWDDLKLDYFDRDKDWQDFISLVRRPAENILEFTDEAVDALYESSAGNPFFTNLICRWVLEHARKTRDSYVATHEVTEAISSASKREPLIRFSHFWDDAILASGDQKELVSLNRRKVLCAIADLMERQVNRPRTAIISHPFVRGMGDGAVLDEVRDLERRGILISGQTDFRFKVELFGSWLRRSGLQQISLQYQGKDSASAVKAEQERLTVRSEEIEAVCAGWTYQGRVIGPARVRHWLNQFGSPEEQRLVFESLTGFRFYARSWIVTEMRSAFDRLRRHYETDENRYYQRRRDFIVTQLDHAGGSATLLSRYFAEENNLADGSVAAMVDIREALSRSAETRVIVALADFIGTGESLRKAIKDLWDECGNLTSSLGLALHVVILVGFQEAAERLRAFCSEHKIYCEIEVREPLDDSAKAFSEKSTVYPDAGRRRAAERLFRKYGERLNEEWPLGYGDSQTLIAFEHNIPNDTLPVFWIDALAWQALFPRLFPRR